MNLVPIHYEVLNDTIQQQNDHYQAREVQIAQRIAALKETAPQVRDTFEYFFNLHHSCPVANLERRPAPLPEERYLDMTIDERYAKVWWEQFKGEFASLEEGPYGGPRREALNRRVDILKERGRGRPEEGKAVSRWRGTNFTQFGERFVG